LCAKLWKEFLWKRSTIKDLAERYHRSRDWIRQQLHNAKIINIPPCPTELVLVADAVFFSRTSGMLVFRNPHQRRNIYWHEIRSETIAEYQRGIEAITGLGFILKAVVLDGRKGIRNLFAKFPVQMCHFHQKAIITRYLTRNPKLEASKELREIVNYLCKTDETSFSCELERWHGRWAGFIRERTTDPHTKCWHYTHKRLRSAYLSLKNNLPFLFTYLRHPELSIPNTTNALDGSFAYLKELILIHRGLHKTLKQKIVVNILQK
jgi:hypothetical protein